MYGKINIFITYIETILCDKLLFVFPLANAQLDLTKTKMLSNGSAKVKHS